MEYTVKDLLEEVRARIGDADCDLDTKLFIASLNTALRRVARSAGLNKLFTYRKSFELASMNKAGDASASWTLNSESTMLTDIQQLRVTDNTGCSVFNTNPCYMKPEDFYACNPIPEQNTAGVPNYFTLETRSGRTKLTFDRPIHKPYEIDITYTAFHPRIKALGDQLDFPYEYADIISEIIVSMIAMESSDYAQALAHKEDTDFLIAEARALLARNPIGFPNRLVGRSW